MAFFFFLYFMFKADLAFCIFPMALLELVFSLTHQRGREKDFIPFAIICETRIRICTLKSRQRDRIGDLINFVLALDWNQDMHLPVPAN